MRLLRTFLHRKPGYSGEPPVQERAEDIRTANGRFEPR
jgi:hypothetical protein